MRKIIIYLVVLATLFSVFFLSSCTLKKENEMKSLLQEPFNLKTSYKPGNRDFYHIKTVCLEMGNAGEGIPISMDFPPLFTETYFKNAPVDITFRGISLGGNELCAILAFRSDDCRVHMVANMNNMKIPIDGVSYYFGEIVLSLET